MSSQTSSLSQSHAQHDPVEVQTDEQDRPMSPNADQPTGDQPSTLEASSIDHLSQNSLRESPVSPPSSHPNGKTGPTALEKESRPSSANINEKGSRKDTSKQAGWWSRLLADTWTIELLAGSISLAALASIVGLLTGYDRKPVPPLLNGITLNTVISFLATISRTAIMVCIGTVLSQGKWLWFKKERSLLDLQNIESASRGPLGSILMLFSLKGGVVLYIAALLTVATLGFDPFVQQLLTIQNRVVPVPATGIGINSTTAMTTDIFAAMDYTETLAQLTAAMLANVQQGEQPVDAITSSISERRMSRKHSDATTQRLSSPLKADCPSGNCIWQPYYALDICTKCRTTTQELTINNLSPSSYDLSAMINAVEEGRVSGTDPITSSFMWEIVPKFGKTWQVASNLSAFIDRTDFSDNALGLQVYGTMMDKVVWPLNFASSDGLGLDTTGWTKQSFADVEEPVAAVGFAAFTFGDNGVPVIDHSSECALTYCVNEYNRSVVQGNLVSEVLSTHYGTVTGDPNTPLDLGWSAEVNDTSFTADPFLRYGTGIGTLAGYLLGNVTRNYAGNCERNNGRWDCSADTVASEGTFGARSIEVWQGIDLTPDFTMVVENANTLMSEIVQQYGNVSVPGDNAVTKAFVVVRWPWIALPATVVIFGLIIFGLMIWETMRLQAPSWKASLLPLLYRYVHEDDGSVEGRDMPSAARSASIQLPPAHDGGLTSSSLVSRFEVEAVATSTRFMKAATAPRVWQLQSLEIIQEDTKGR